MKPMRMKHAISAYPEHEYSSVPGILSYAGESCPDGRSITVHIGSMLVVFHGMISALCLKPPAEQLPLLV
jgi:hypothetical protein